MIDAVSVARTALDAQSVNTSVIADNIANAVTPNYQPKQTTMIPMNPGVAVGPIMASAEASVDVGNEFVNLIAAKNAYAAAAKVISASNEMTRTLLASV